MKHNKKRRTIRFKITRLMLINVGVIIVSLCLFNAFFLKDFYFEYKQKQLSTAYNRMSNILESYNDGKITKTEFEHRIERLCQPLNISAIILRSDWVAIYATATNNESLKERMTQNILGSINQEDVIENNDKYVLQRVYDSKMEDEYLEIFGYVDADNTLLMRVPLKSIDDSAQISNQFIIRVGTVFILIAIISADIIAIQISKPIKKISELAEKMSDIKFDERYTDEDNDEIGVLGLSLNKLADKLDFTISELKTANNELKNDIASKEQQEIARVDFIANVSHELKTPIALIQGYAEGLRDGIYDSPENAEYYCDVIIDEAQKMNDMVKKLLSLNQLESGNDQIVMEKFDVTELIKSIAEANAIRAMQKGIVVNVDIHKSIKVWADEFRIEEVITNYVTNAINHCEGEKKITITAVEGEETVRIGVKNTGKQIPKEDIERVWEKFYKVDKARTREYGGNGIGLSIVKAIMESHNKSYGVQNHEDGVEFWFELDTKAEM